MQIKSVLRNRKSIHDADKGTTKFSKIIFGLTMVQLIIALFQFGFDAILSENPILGGFILCGIVLFMWWILDMVDKHNNK